MENPACVLTIDDEPGIRQNLTAYLEECGYLVLEAENGNQGLQVFLREQPDVVLAIPAAKHDVLLATMLDAHRTLMSLSEHNRLQFKDVVEALERESEASLYYDYSYSP